MRRISIYIRIRVQQIISLIFNLLLCIMCVVSPSCFIEKTNNDNVYIALLVPTNYLKYYLNSKAILSLDYQDWVFWSRFLITFCILALIIGILCVFKPRYNFLISAVSVFRMVWLHLASISMMRLSKSIDKYLISKTHWYYLVVICMIIGILFEIYNVYTVRKINQYHNIDNTSFSHPYITK